MPSKGVKDICMVCVCTGEVRERIDQVREGGLKPLSQEAILRQKATCFKFEQCIYISSRPHKGMSPDFGEKRAQLRCANPQKGYR